MDESWRMRMGMFTAPPPPTEGQLPNYPPRRSVEDTSHTASHRLNIISDDPLNPEHFSDVFGGPPRTILSRQFFTGCPRSSSSATFSFEEIFRPPEKAAPPLRRSGRNLPEFKIPSHRRSNHYHQKRENDGFYSDIFGCEDERMVRSRSRSKASSSSVLSSEELSPLRLAISFDSDEDVSFFASKLRPINVRSRWTSRRTENEDDQRQQNITPPFSGIQSFHNTENNGPDNLMSYPFGFGLSRRNASPETISLEPISNGSFRVSADDLELNSASPAISSVCHSLDHGHKIEDESLKQDDAMEQDEDEAMSSYVIEINSDNREGTCESNGVDEAIAWAKEKFHTNYSESKCNMQECEAKKITPGLKILSGHQISEGHTDSFGSLDEQLDKWATVEETQQLECMLQNEMQILDEKIRLWSTGKKADIRLLLSSLHHILWPSSGWSPISLANIIEISQVKKAYQKVQLCLHLDKLQQRGATLPQKYIAEKAFSVLQDAWAAFISQDLTR